MFSSQSHLPSSLSPCPQLKTKKRKKGGVRFLHHRRMSEQKETLSSWLQDTARNSKQPMLVPSVYKRKTITPFMWGCFCCLWLYQTASKKVLQERWLCEISKILLWWKDFNGSPPFVFYFQHVHVLITTNLLQWLTVFMWMCLHGELQRELKMQRIWTTLSINMFFYLLLVVIHRVPHTHPSLQEGVRLDKSPFVH